MNKRPNKDKVQTSLTRIAIVNSDRCKPKNCGQACKKVCPIVKQGKLHVLKLLNI